MAAASKSNTVEIVVALKNLTQKGVEGAERGLGKIGKAAGGIADKVLNVQNVLAGLGIGAVFLKGAEDARAASDQIAASLDVPAQKAKELEGVARRVFEEGYGDSAMAASKTVITAFQQMGDVGEKELGKAATKAEALFKRFDADQTKSITAANELMEKFGITSDQAFDFIAAGYQRGLDSSGDFLDSIGEYSTQFQSAGATADQFFSALETGSQAGVLGTDKIADSFKEARLRLSEMADGTKGALTELGVNADQLSQQMKSGTLSAADAYQLVIDALNKVENQNERTRLGAQILGTQYEDMGSKAAESINLAATSLDDLQGASDKLLNAYTTLTEASTRLWRNFIGGANEAATGALDFFVGEINKLNEAVTRLRESGKLEEWARAVSAAMIEAYEKAREFTGQVIAFLKEYEPLIKTMIGMAPELLAVAAGFKAVSVGAGAVSGVLGGVSSLLGGSAKAATGLTGALQGVGKASLAAKLGIAGLIASLSAGAVIKAGQEFLKMRDAIKTAKESQDRFLESADRLMQKTKEFKDIKLPADFAQKPLAELEKLHQSLQNGRRYWKAMEMSLADTQDGSKKMADALANAREQVARFDDDIGRVSGLIGQAFDAGAQGIEAQVEALKAGLENQIAAIEGIEQSGVISHEEATRQKIEAETAFKEQRTALINEAIATSKAKYGEDSEAYKAAVAQKQAADASFTESSKTNADARAKAWADAAAKAAEADKQAVEETKKRTESTTQAYKDAREATEKTTEAIKKSNAEMTAASVDYSETASEGQAQVADAAEAAADKAESTMKEAHGRVRDMFASPIDVNINTDPAEAALTRMLEAYQKDIATAMAFQAKLIADANASGGKVGQMYRDQARAVRKEIQQMERQAADAARTLQQQLGQVDLSANVNFTGTGSPTRPLSEKIKEVIGQVGGFRDAIKNAAGSIDTKIPSIPSPSFAAAAPGPSGSAAPAQKVRDMGATEIRMGGKGYPVQGDPNVIQQLQTELRRYRLTKG